MKYIQKSAVRSHGSLKSSKCLIDSRWVLKVSGFGLVKFREGASNNEETEFKHFERMLWTAPELLRLSKEERPQKGTQKGDVYSFGIIVQEVIYRAAPFFDSETPKGELDNDACWRKRYSLLSFYLAQLRYCVLASVQIL